MGKFLPFSTQGHCIDLILCPTRAGSDLRRVQFDERTGSRSGAPEESRLTVRTALQSEEKHKKCAINSRRLLKSHRHTLPGVDEILIRAHQLSICKSVSRIIHRSKLMGRFANMV